MPEKVSISAVTFPVPAYPAAAGSKYLYPGWPGPYQVPAGVVSARGPRTASAGAVPLTRRGSSPAAAIQACQPRTSRLLAYKSLSLFPEFYC
jgi:hypothetical protein